MYMGDEKWEKKRRIIDEHNKFSPLMEYPGRKNPPTLNGILIVLIVYILLCVLAASLTPINTSSGENEARPHPIIRIGRVPIVF